MSVRGEGKFGILVVGGGEWTEIGRAKWDSMMRRMGWTGDQVWLTSLTGASTKANGNWLADNVIADGREELRKLVERLSPRCVVAMGDLALRELTGYAEGKRALKYVRGFVLPSWLGVPVVATFEPESWWKPEQRVIPMAAKLTGLVMKDLGKALKVSQGREGICFDPSTEVEVISGVEGLKRIIQELTAKPDLLLAYDLETKASSGEDEDTMYEFARDQVHEDDETSDDEIPVEWNPGAVDTSSASITTIQFAVSDRWGVSAEWGKETYELSQQIFNQAKSLAGHNVWMFDNPILERHGNSVHGCVHDTLWMWHAIQPDLPAHLQGVSEAYGWLFPWKHMAGSHFEFYGVVDVCAVIRIMSRLPKDLVKLGAWEGYDRLTREFHTILRQMERRGIPVNKTKLDAFREWLTLKVNELNGELQGQIPSELLGWEPKEGLKVLPPEVKEWIVEECPKLVAPVTKTYKNGKTREVASKVTGKDLYKLLATRPIELDNTLTKLESSGYGWRQFGDESRLVRPVEWNPRSSQQLIAYVKYKKYPVPTKFKDGKATTGDKEMEKLQVATKDPVLKLTREIRATSKMINAYTGRELGDGSIKGGWWPAEEDERLRATFTFGPATWQLGAKNPNVLTTPKRRKELAKKFRECIVAEPGHRLVEIDYTAFHARTLGLEAQDASYMRLAALDIHSYVTGWLVKWRGIETALDMGDASLKLYLKEIKAKHEDVRNFKAKPSILGIGFGMGVRRLYFENRESFEIEAEARRLLDLLKSIFPKVFKWQDDICDKADSEGKLVSKWGAVRWFFEVRKWERKGGGWKSSNGKDAEKVKAFFPSNDAHGMLRNKLMEMERFGLLDKWGLVNVIHDAVLFHCPEEFVEECASEAKKILVAPELKLSDPIVAPQGFTCGCEVMVGKDWANMEELK